METLTTASPRWKSFARVLGMVMEGRGCDNDRGLNPDTPELVRCGARAVMEAMGGIDIEATMKYFDDHGGYCDCEIRYNVDTGPGSTEDGDEDNHELTADESRWFDTAEQTVKPLEPVRAKAISRERIRKATRALLELLQDGIQRDEFHTALEAAYKQRCADLDQAMLTGKYPNQLPQN
jgi:hypothetical protein